MRIAIMTDTNSGITAEEGKQTGMIEAIKNDIASRFANISAEKLQIAVAGSLQNQEDITHWHDTVQSAFPNMNVYYNPLPCSIVSHVGPDCMGIGVTVIKH